MATKVQSQSLLSWQAPEFYYYPKTGWWYGGIVGIGVAILLVLWLFNQLDWTNGPLVVVGAFALLRLTNRPPRTISIGIQTTGVAIGTAFYAFDRLTSFHLTDHGPYQTLDLQQKNFSFPISAVVADQDPERIRTTIGQYLPEKTTSTVYISDTVSRWFRF